MKSIEQLKKKDLNCNIFSVYDYDGLTITELLCQFFTKISECIDASNETLDLVEWMVNFGIEEEVSKKIVELIKDGTIENLINDNLFSSLNQTKADKEEVASQVATKRDKNVKITSGDLDVSDDNNKIKMINLSEEVKQAISGTAPVIGDVVDNSITNSKLAEGSVTSIKLNSDYNFIKTLNNTDDLNAKLKSGVYFIQPTISRPANFPSELANDNAIMIQNNFEGGWAIQTIKNFTNPNISMIRRINSDAPSANTIWTYDKNSLGLKEIQSINLSSQYDYKGILNNTNDLNKVKESGIYMIQNTISQPLNVPLMLKNSTCILFNKVFENAYSIQYLFDFTKPSQIITRTITHAGDVIKDWGGIGNTLKLANKNLLTMGDSITAPNIYQEEFKNVLGCDIVNIGYAGAKVTYYNGEHNGSQTDQMFDDNSFYIRSKNVDLNNIDTVWIAYGTNDYSNSVELGTIDSGNPKHFKYALYEGLKSLLTRKPNLNIFVGSPLYRTALRDGNLDGDIFTTVNDAGFLLKDYSDAIEEVCSIFGIPVFNGLRNGGINKFNIDTWLLDKLHPTNPNGYHYIGKKYAEFINQYI